MKNHLVHIIEANSIYRKLLSNKLRELACIEVREFETIDSSLDNLSVKPSFLILDYNLIKENGINCIPIYREFLPEAKIIILSSEEQVDNFVSVFELGADKYIRNDVYEIARVMSYIETAITVPEETSWSWIDYLTSGKALNKKNKTIYVLEDNPNSAFIIEHLLSSESKNKVTAFTRSFEFIGEFFRSKPDIVVLDYFLDEKVNGMDLLKRIKKEFIDVIVIILSGQKDASLAADLMKEGASYYFVKSKESLTRLKSVVECI